MKIVKRLIYKTQPESWDKNEILKKKSPQNIKYKRAKTVHKGLVIVNGKHFRYKSSRRKM